MGLARRLRIYSKSPDPGAGQQNIGPTACVGLAFLHTGRISEAERAGEFICGLLQEQEGSAKLYLSRDDSGAIVTDFDPDYAALHLMDLEASGQAYWFLGFMMALLGKLYAATGKKEYLASGISAFDIFGKCRGITDADYTSGTVGWGAAVLHAQTGDERFAECALKILRMLVDTRQSDGTWHWAALYENRDKQPIAFTLDLSVEMALWCVEISRELSGRKSPDAGSRLNI